MGELKPGLELGARYALLRQLGRGGHAEVWLARRRPDDAELALKIIDPELLREAGGEARLAEELALVGELPGDVAVRMHGLERLDGWLLIPMDYMQGGDLGQFRGRSFASWSAPLAGLCKAIAALHERGLVHRDIKCANVLLDGDGRVRLADFGLATLAGVPAARGGSPYNASPQQLRGEPPQPADDLYALGALLYELISGHPPYYPDITRDRVLHEPVPPLQPRGTVPVRVRELALRLLAKSPSQRPASIADVQAQLRAAAAGDDEAAPLAAPRITAAAGGAAGARRRRGWLWAGLGVIAAAVAVFLWLPGYVAGRSAAIAEQARAQAEADARSRNEALAREAAMQQARAEADAAREAWQDAWTTAEGRAASRWATAALAQARAQDAAASQHYALGAYAEARAGWEAGLQALADLEAGKPAALAAALGRGAAALREGDTRGAREAYELALAIEPASQAAKTGRQRADRLDEAFAAMDEGAAAERAGRLDAARASYRRALALDGETPGAQAALARLAAREAGDAYASAMAAGINHMAAGRAGEARAAFQRAAALRPDAAEPQEALTQLEQGQRAAALRLLEARARTAESAEQWAEAVAAWREALALDPGFAAAREALPRGESRQQLASRMQALLDNPERLWSSEVRVDARALVAAARAAPAPNAEARRRAGELERMVLAAEVPVPVSLVSDGMTEVVIYRVARFGKLDRRELELLPGRYTVVGTRRGFRDVRVELEILPGASLAPVVVKCEEAI